MIAYVLVMIVSLQTGQTTQAVLEGPMSRNWCQQLILQDRYKGEDGKNRKLPTCLSGTDAQHTLTASSCKRSPGPSPRWPSIQYDCAPAPVQVSMAVTEEIPDAPVTGVVTDDSSVPPQVATGSTASLPAHPIANGVATAAAKESVTVAMPSLPYATPTPPAPVAAPPVPEPPPVPVPAPAPQRQIHMGAAASALLGQAEKQSASGEHAEAAATLERALRIEPENPLLWMELGRLRMAEGKAEPAEGLYRKALTLAAGDGVVEARAWALLAESLRARGRNQEAAAAQAHISGASPN